MARTPSINEIQPNTGRVQKEDDSVVNVGGSFYTDPDGNVQVSQIEVLHTLVHQKKMHTVSSRQATTAAGVHDILIKASATKDVHLRIGYSSEDFAFFDTIADVVETGGTVYPAFNRVIGEPSTLTCTVKKNITSYTGGSTRGQDFIGQSGATSQRAGGTGSSDIETVIESGHNLLIRLTRVETGTKYTGIICNLYERNPLTT